MQLPGMSHYSRVPLPSWLAMFLVNGGKDAKTIQGLLRNSRVASMLDLYSKSVDVAKIEAQENIPRRQELAKRRIIAKSYKFLHLYNSD